MMTDSNVNKIETQCNSSVHRLTSSLSSFEKIASSAKETGVLAHIARQYMSMYTRAKTKLSPTILELGTREGISTSMFLKICQENGGKVVSVDVDDCSDVADDENWRFVQSDSTDVEHVLAKAPELSEGIDVLLIDSLHVRSHVEKEFYAWYPYLNAGALVFFDDVDPFIYRKNSRKDSLYNEFNWQDIQDFVVEVFRANEDYTSLTFYLGSSGLALLEKFSPIGEVPIKPKKQIYRDRLFYYRLRMNLIRLKNSILNRG